MTDADAPNVGGETHLVAGADEKVSLTLTVQDLSTIVNCAGLGMGFLDAIGHDHDDHLE